MTFRDSLRRYCVNTMFSLFRWVKFEEVLEEEGKRWSKPHVSSFPMLAISELLDTIRTAAIFLNMEAQTMPQIVGQLALYLVHYYNRLTCVSTMTYLLS